VESGIDEPWIRPTAHGRRFLNDLQSLFLPAPDARPENLA
jgi:hypothetical protein